MARARSAALPPSLATFSTTVRPRMNSPFELTVL